MESNLKRSWMALACMLAIATVALWPDVVLAQTEGVEVITQGGLWLITLIKAAAAVFLFFSFLGLIFAAANSSGAGIAIAILCILFAAAVIVGGDAAAERLIGAAA